MAATIEATQVHLEGLGVLLWPGIDPPDRIDVLDVRRHEGPVFEKANELGRVVYYDQDHRRKCWTRRPA